MDMISRNAPEDTAKRILSIGTGPAETPLIELAKKVNNSLPHPFTLDLWDVTGYSGSDYASFAALNILVMTYFAGYHPDYHTPRDVAAKADLIKMQDVLRVVNGCVDELMGRGKK